MNSSPKKNAAAKLNTVKIVNEVGPMDIALLAAMLARSEGCKAEQKLADAVKLLAKAVTLVPDVCRHAGYVGSLEKQHSFEEVVESTGVQKRTLKKYCKILGLDPGAGFSSSAVTELFREIQAAKSRKQSVKE